MTIEIVQRETCPTCGGTGKELLPEQESFGQLFPSLLVDCCACEAKGFSSVVLATFADAGALREAIERMIDDAAIHRKYEQGVTDAVNGVLNALGVSE